MTCRVAAGGDSEDWQAPDRGGGHNGPDMNRDQTRERSHGHYFVTIVTSSNCVTESAFVQRPTLPGCVNVASSTS